MTRGELTTMVLGLVLWVALAGLWWGPMAAIISGVVIAWLSTGVLVLLLIARHVKGQS